MGKTDTNSYARGVCDLASIRTRSTGALLSGDDVTADDVTGIALMTNADSLEYSTKILSSIFTRILHTSNLIHKLCVID